VEEIRTHILCSPVPPPPPENHSVYDNVGKCGGAREATNDDIIWLVHVTCWVSKATRACTHADRYVILNCFFTVTVIRERESLLPWKSEYVRCTYIACLVYNQFLVAACVLNTVARSSRLVIWGGSIFIAYMISFNTLRVRLEWVELDYRLHNVAWLKRFFASPKRRDRLCPPPPPPILLCLAVNYIRV
jgi:hypothetical protein